MFSKLIGLALTVSSAFAYNQNTAETTYIIASFNAGEFPMRVSSCNPTSVLGAPYQIAECEDDGSITLTLYLADDCTGTVYAGPYNFNNTQTGLGTFADYNCDAATESYANVEFGLDNCETLTKAAIDAAVGVCAGNTGYTYGVGSTFTTDEYRQIEVYCDGKKADLNYFTYELYDPCAVDNFYQVRNASLECGYMLTSGEDDIYGTLYSCVIEDIEQVGNDDDDSASTTSIIIALFATFFAAFSM
jgi:hypothetical protein